MDDKRKEELRELAEHWAEVTIDAWFCEYGAWDDMIDDGDLSYDELRWINDNVSFSVTAHKD